MPMPISSDGFSQRHIRLPVDCPICHRPSLYNYYNARCCECCKQFFRRTIMKQRKFLCKKSNGNCQIEKGENCHSCRLDRCLIAGMDPLLVKTVGIKNANEYLLNLVVRKRKLDEQNNANSSPFEDQKHDISLSPQGQMEISKMVLPSSPKEFEMLDSLLFLESKQHQIWNALTEAPNSYLDRFKCLEDLLRHPGNILAKAEEFIDMIPAGWNKETYMEMSEQFGVSIPENFHYMAIDRFLVVEMAKTLPFFRRLDIKDQVCLLQHASMPLCIFLNAFYSASRGADTWTRANGQTFICAYDAKQLSCHRRLQELSKKKLCNTVAVIKRIGMDRSEFVLLMAILYCNSANSNLSQLAKDQLYNESVRYSRALLQLLQQKDGDLAGANRYAQLIHLAGLMVEAEQIMDMLIIYMEMFNLCQQVPNYLEAVSFPKALLKLL